MNLVDHLDKLAPFCVVADLGTIREAAEKLHLTQPALTRLIQKLESATQTRLFYRSRSGVQLTPQGQELLIYSKKILKDLEELKIKLKNPGNNLAGLLRIGSYETLAEYLWPDFLQNFKKINPYLKLHVKTNIGLNQEQGLLSEDIDILLDAEPRFAGEFTSWKLYEDRFFFCIHSRNHEHIEKGLITNLPLIYVPGAYDVNNQSLLEHIESAGYFFQEKIELDSFTAVRTFTKKNLGLGVLPGRLFDDDSAHLKKITLHDINPKGFGAHHICATVLSHRAEEFKIKFLVQQLRAWYKN